MKAGFPKKKKKEKEIMSTLQQLIDRTYREYLRPVEEQEPLSQLSVGIDDSASTTSITYESKFMDT